MKDRLFDNACFVLDKHHEISHSPSSPAGFGETGVELAHHPSCALPSGQSSLSFLVMAVIWSSASPTLHKCDQQESPSSLILMECCDRKVGPCWHPCTALSKDDKEAAPSLSQLEHVGRITDEGATKRDCFSLYMECRVHPPTSDLCVQPTRTNIVKA